jgi:hypothetical protein
MLATLFGGALRTLYLELPGRRAVQLCGASFPAGPTPRPLVSSWLAALPKLERLELSEHGFTFLDADFSRLSTLTRANLGTFDGTSDSLPAGCLPPPLCELGLRFVGMAPPVELPLGLVDATGLRALSIDGRFEDLAAGLEELVNLAALRCESYGDLSVPLELSALTQLQ